VWSGALATAGGVVFYGTMDGWFKAVDARDGRLLWKYKRPRRESSASRSSYRAPDGHQYVAVLAGRGRMGRRDRLRQPRSARRHFRGRFRERDARPARCDEEGGMLYVFRLP
jgi:hypothetical protein